MKKSKQILNYLKDVTIVVIGVLIAVSIGNYKENLSNKVYLKKTLKAIEGEVISSQSDIDTVLKRHIELYVKFENEFEESDQTLVEFLVSSGGFQVAAIKNISLRFFVSNKAELLEYEMISQLLEIESIINILSVKVERFSDFAYNRFNDKDKEVKKKFTYLLADEIESEQTLLESYSSFLNENSKYFKENNN
jgi:hypothetical protein